MSATLLIKLKSAFYSTLVLGLLYFLVEIFIDGLSGFFIIAFFFAGIGNFLYGIPVSYFSDFLKNKVDKYKFNIAAFIHILFGFLTIFVIGELGLFAVFCSLFFFLFDEWQKKSVRKKDLNKKVILTNGFVVIFLFSLGLIGATQLVPDLQEKTHDYYIIPEGYVGEVIVVYDIKHAPQPKKIGNYNVITINDKGYGITQLPVSEGIIEDKYFYIAKEGNKKEIDEGCINGGGIQSISGDGYEYTSSSFTVTDKACGNDFMIEGDPSLPEGLSLEEILLEENLAEIKDYMIDPKQNLKE